MGGARATALVALAVLAACPAAAAQTGARQQASLGLTSAQPGAPTGSRLSVDFQDPANPGGKPYTVARIVIALPAGSVIDTTVPEQCKATDLQLIVQGASACPAGSRLGTGELVTDSGSPGVIPRFTTNRLTSFNNQDEQVGLAESDSPPTRMVSRSKISGSSVTAEFPAIPLGNPSPDPFLAYKSLRLNLDPIVRGGRTYARTPPTCPRSRRWTASLTFVYRDGVTQTVLSHLPCRPGHGHAPHRADRPEG